MGTVKKLSEEIARGLSELLPGLNKPVTRKLSLAVAAMLEAQTPNTVDLSNVLPLETERQDMREQWLRRLLTSPALRCEEAMSPFAIDALRQASGHGQTILLSLDQTDLGDRMAILMLAVCVGGRALPLAWAAEEGPANMGFAQQEPLLERALAWLPAGAKVMLLADRFYPSAGLFRWLQSHGWQYRLRLKGNLLADPGFGDETTAGALLPPGETERYLAAVRLFGKDPVMAAIGILREAGHDEPWIIAMDCPPTRAAVLDYGARWSIEPTFSDFKSRGFRLEGSQLKHAPRLERLVLLMALAMHWCVRIGRDNQAHCPTPLEKKHNGNATHSTGASGSSHAAWCPGSQGGYGS